MTTMPTELAREFLARAHYRRASLGKAVELSRLLLEADPTGEYATLLLARGLERKGHNDEALGLRRRLAALTGDPRRLPNHHAGA